jgi:hypothetical protein
MYIVLNGKNAVLSDSDTKLTWAIQSHYFKNFSEEDRLEISMVSANFSATITGDYDYATNYIEVLTDLRFNNVTNTNNDNTLAIVNCETDFTVGTSTSDYIPNVFYNECSPFNSISLTFRQFSETLRLAPVLTDGEDVNKDDFVFVLKLKTLKK